MKTFKLVGMALVAILLCVNFTSCSKDDGPTEEPEEGGVVVSGKKLTKISASMGANSATYSFNYDNQGRLIQSDFSEEYEGDKYTESYQFVWGDDVIKVSRVNGSSYTLNLNNKLVRNSDNGATFSYNSSNKFIKGKDNYNEINVIWDGDKLVSISDQDADATLTYDNKSCKKGYFPFSASMIGFCCEMLFMAHPEIAGMRTTQLPSSITWVDRYETEASTLTYEFDNEGYISKVNIKEGSNTYTHTLTWK